MGMGADDKRWCCRTTHPPVANGLPDMAFHNRHRGRYRHQLMKLRRGASRGAVPDPTRSSCRHDTTGAPHSPRPRSPLPLTPSPIGPPPRPPGQREPVLLRATTTTAVGRRAAKKAERHTCEAGRQGEKLQALIPWGGGTGR
jgi:hypothetical protein